MLLACNRDKVVLNIQTSNHHTIIDSIPFDGELFPYKQSHRSGYYPIYYLGIKADTLHLGRNPISFRRYGQKNYDEVKWFVPIDSSNLKLVVDTNVHLTYRNNYPSALNVSNYLAYPIFIYNTADTLIDFGISNSLTNVVRQVRNKQGQWVDIETPTQISCGRGLRDLVLEPGYIAMAKLIRYAGAHKAPCRLKLSHYRHIVYSNTFYDYIDERQLSDSLPHYW